MTIKNLIYATTRTVDEFMQLGWMDVGPYRTHEEHGNFHLLKWLCDCPMRFPEWHRHGKILPSNISGIISTPSGNEEKELKE